jgi:hypothetical protein
MAVVDAFESGIVDLPDFYFTGDDHRYRFEAEAKQRFLDLLRGRFNSGVRYNGRVLKWDTVIERKAVELGCFLVGRSRTLDFSEPSPTFQRTDNHELRRRILSLPQSKARKLGMGKSTLHYLRRKTSSSRGFRLYKPTLEKIMTGS